MRWFSIPPRWRPVAAWWALVVLAAACGGGKDGGATGPGGGGGDVVGDYMLVGADNNGLPAVVESEGCSAIQVLNGDISLNTDGTFSMQLNWNDTDGQTRFTGDHGHYRQTNNGLQFSSETWGDQFQGEAEGDQVSVQWDFCGDTPGAEMGREFSR